MLADMVLEEELRVLCLEPQASKGKLWHTDTSELLKPQNLPPQSHTSSNKTTAPNSGTPYGPSTQTHESTGLIPN